MPKKPKSEPNATEPRKPGEMTPSSSDRKEAASPTQKRGRGRMRGFRMSEEHRTKIQNSRILRVLIDHVEGREEISQARVTAALGLLKKVLPDLQAVTIGAIRRTPSVMSTRSISRRCQTTILLSFSAEAHAVSPYEATPLRGEVVPRRSSH
jgi:hypothetical protein